MLFRSYNAVKWTSQCQKDLVPAWDDPSQMEDKCKEFAKTMNDIIASESK